MPDHSPSTDERASLAQPSQSSSPLECTSHLGFSLVLDSQLGISDSDLVLRDNIVFVSRGEAIGFALRTRKNLEFVRDAFEQGQDVHVVTHLVNSLLGIVVVPKERYFEETFWAIGLDELAGRGWPGWNVSLDDSPRGKTKTLGDLIWHFRNASAHGRFSFTGEPESRYLSEVGLVVEDGPPEVSEPKLAV